MVAPTWPYTLIDVASGEADQPLDETLVVALIKDIIHLEEWVGDSYTAAKDHDHDNVNSKSVVIPSGSIGQGELKTGESEVSRTRSTAGSTSSNLTLPGGSYGFYPRVRSHNPSDQNGAQVSAVIASVLITSNVNICNVYLTVTRTGGSDAFAYARQRYVTATGTEHWLFLLVDKTTGIIVSGYQAPDHPMFGNGEDESKVPHPFIDYFDKDPASDGYAIVLIDIDDTNKIKKNKKNGDSRSMLEIVNYDYIVDMSKTVSFKPRDMNGKKMLDTVHPSYTVRKLKKK